MNRQLIWMGMMCFLTSCISNPGNNFPSWPEDDQISISWKLLDDAPDGEDKRTSLFTITNHSKQPIAPGWHLYFSQFPTTFYIPASAENRYEMEMLDGDLARILSLDSLSTIEPGKSVTISYQWPVRMIKNSHAPHGLFFVLPDQSVHDVVNFSHDPIPASFSFDTKSGPEPIHISAKKRYEANQAVYDINVADLSPILPTPLSLKQTAGTFGLTTTTGGQIQYADGLEQEARYLALALKEVLQGELKVVAGNGADAFISLQLSTLPQAFAKEGYQLKISEKSITIVGSDPAGVFYGIQSLKALIPAGFYSVPGTEIFLPQVDINDAPRFAYRGQLVDVARNFQSVETIKKVIQLMASYKLNRLHFHITDDEGWRLEIPDLPELTEIGAKRGYSADQNAMLPPAYGSAGHTEMGVGTGSGFYTREQFIDILKFANAHYVEIIPEINGPGHARAAIKAMQSRYDRLMKSGDESAARAYLLHDRSDQSIYTSAQNYHDNVICVCQENTYTFLEKVVAEVVAMYKEADAPLRMIHTGGDEVPHGAWTKSPECDRLIRDESSIHSVEDLHPYFVSRYLEIAKKYELKIGGWEEITLKAGDKGDKPNPEFVGKGVVSYAWNAKIGSGGEDMAYQLANVGYEVVMANASNLYFDLAYNYEPEEPGLFWAGYVDTKNAFELTPSNIFLSIFEDEEGNALDGLSLSRERMLLQPGAAENIIGIQGALWGEAIKSAEMVEYALLPKLLGLAERAWSRSPAWATKNSRAELKKSIDNEWSKFANRIGKLELPRLDFQQGGFAYRISPPGASVENGILHANVAYPGLQIRYTLDGKDPDINAPLYEGPIDIGESGTVKVRAFTTNKRGSRIATIDIKPQPLN